MNKVELAAALREALVNGLTLELHAEEEDHYGEFMDFHKIKISFTLSYDGAVVCHDNTDFHIPMAPRCNCTCGPLP